MKNIYVRNKGFLQDNIFKLSRTSKVGFIFAVCLGIGVGAISGYIGVSQDESQDVFTSGTEVSSNISMRDQIFIDEDETIIPYQQEGPINVSLEQINSLNIIINDNDCREDFVNKVCEELDKDGIKYAFTKGNDNVNVDGAVVITLDQQYIAGPATVVLAPLKNGRNGNSDALALSAERALYEKGFLIDGIICGQTGFRENDNGTVSERIPTATETAIDNDKNTSFITISFGTQNTHAGLTASSIESMLTRYYSYIYAGYENEDLIYCVENGESYDDIASKMGTTKIDLDDFNNTLDENMLITGETILNPVVASRKEFNKHVPTNLYIDKTIWSR